MNASLQTVFSYHDRTKHAPNRYARSLGYMQWSTQPNPFRSYERSEKRALPLALDHATPPYHLLFDELPVAPLAKESLSQLLQFSMGISAWKEANGSRWALRCNASSGNLHPSEAYLILPPLFDADTTVCHYAPKDHALELLARFQTDFWDRLPEGSFLLGLSSISWREVWKYGERAFRYCQLDAGHAWRSIDISAKMLGWHATRLDQIDDPDLQKLLGLDQSERFFETEQADMLLLISPTALESSPSLDTLIENLPLRFEGIANRLSPAMHEWELIPLIEEATFGRQIPQKTVSTQPIPRIPTQESKKVVLQRRSAQMMSAEHATITLEAFRQLMASITPSLDGKENSAHLVIFLHEVTALDQGLYILIRNETHKETLKKLCDSQFLWEETPIDKLYLLKKANFKEVAKRISCSQDIAKDGAFSLGMLCEFSGQIQEFGAHRYKELYWECGAIGQQLYLEATSIGLSATGIGCFLDDTMHDLLGLDDNRFQILYHFTVGRALVDPRVTTLPPYEAKAL